MAPLRVSTTKSEWLPDDPTAFVPTRLWKLPFITTWDDSRNQNRPTDSAEEAEIQNKLGGARKERPVPLPVGQRDRHYDLLRAGPARAGHDVGRALLVRRGLHQFVAREAP